MNSLFALVISPSRTNRLLIGKALAQQGLDSRYLNEGHAVAIEAYLDLHRVMGKTAPAFIVMDEDLGRETIASLLQMLRQHPGSQHAQLVLCGSEKAPYQALINQWGVACVPKPEGSDALPVRWMSQGMSKKGHRATYQKVLS